jgi:hypothetical protein
MIGAKLSFRALTTLAGAFIALVTGGPAFAEQRPADAQIAIVRPLEFIRVENLDYGRVIRGQPPELLPLRQMVPEPKPAE